MSLIQLNFIFIIFETVKNPSIAKQVFY